MKYKNTKIIKLQGGYGNHLYQVAFGEVLKSKTGVKVFYDLGVIQMKGNIKNRPWIGLFFDKVNVNIDLWNVNRLERLAVSRLKLFREGECNKYVYDFDAKCFDNDKTNIFFGRTYFQNFRYFQGYEKEIREMFTKLNAKYEHELDDRNKAMIKDMQSHKNSVVINIRLGDFLKYEGMNICNFDYYKRAMKVFENMEDVHYYVFSDDMEGARKYFKTDKPHTFVDINPLEKPYLNLILSSSAKHNIISNSTFAVWAGFLNSNPNKIVVCPSEVMRKVKQKSSSVFERQERIYQYSVNAYPQEWIKIDTTNDKPIVMDEIDTALTKTVKDVNKWRFPEAKY